MIRHSTLPHYALCHALSVAAAVFMSLLAEHSDAACNLIPIARNEYPSTLAGVTTPITAPGKTVRLVINTCDGSPGFEPVPSANSTVVRFEPPGGATTDVIVSSVSISVDDCTLAGGRCAVLEFTMPSTVAELPPTGLAGPARILVEDSGAQVVADIRELFLPTATCAREPETVFGRFTVLPPANSFADAADGSVSELFATVDGSGNLLVPFDYWGGGIKSVLAETPGAPVAVFLDGVVNIPALGALDPNTILDVVSAQPDPSHFVRSFTLDGRPLPPLLRVTTDGSVFGTADAVESVLRVARNNGEGGPDLFDVTDRLFSNRGPIILDDFSVQVQDPVPLAGLRSTNQSIAFARDESREVTSLNGDGDNDDLVAGLIDPASGTQFNTGKAASLVRTREFFAPAVTANGDLTAFLESEAAQGAISINGDGDIFDNMLRVYRSDFTQVTAAAMLDAAPDTVIDDFPVGIGDKMTFFRTPNSFVDFIVDGVNGAQGIDAVGQMVLSPDGKNLYVKNGFFFGSLAVYSRDATTGALTFVQEIFDQAGVAELNNFDGVAVSPDGKHVYATASPADFSFVTVFSRNSTTGVLTSVQILPFGEVMDVANASGDALVFSPDGEFAYAIAAGADSVVVFDRNTTSGVLTQIQELPGLAEITRSIRISGDGSLVFAGHASYVYEYERNPGTGLLSPTVRWDMFGSGSSDFEVSPDARFFYRGGPSGRVTVYERKPVAPDPVTPRATTIQQFDVNSGTSPKLNARGDRIYFRRGSGFDEYKRSDASGRIELLRSFDQGIAGVSGLTDLFAIAPSPDGAHIYASGTTDDAIAIFRVHGELRAFDTELFQLMTESPIASEAAVAGDRAVLIAEEWAVGMDLNDDGDQGDRAALLYDLSGGGESLVPLGVAANRVAISDQLIAISVPERGQNALDPLGVDLNGDGDTNDDVVMIQEIGQPISPVSLGIANDGLAITGTTVVARVPEQQQNQTDLNGDNDTDDSVLHIYDFATDTVTNTMLNAQDFVAAGPLVAFRVSERQQGKNVDLNDDGNGATGTKFVDVMHIYNDETGEVINTRVAAIDCDLPGCPARLPYKVENPVVSFLTREQDQGPSDLNGDGDDIDLVLTVFHVRSHSATTIGTAVDDYSSNAPAADPTIVPFPGDFLGSRTIVLETRESVLGEDVNADGVVTDDLVTVLVADSDGDGHFDDHDTCAEFANPANVDGDVDGLGDGACDTDSPPICGDLPRIGCSKSVLPGKSALKIQEKGPLKRTLQFKLAGGEAAALADFGDPVSGDARYTLCIHEMGNIPFVSGQLFPLAQADCTDTACWKPISTKGYGYSRKGGFPFGIERILLRAGGEGQTALKIKAKGQWFSRPQPPRVPPVVVQFIAGDGLMERCWEGEFSEPSKNDAKQFKAKSQ